MAGRLANKVVLITGTAGGQGRAAALRFAAEGAEVIGCDVDVDGSARTVEAVRSVGGRMTASAPVDLGESSQATAWVKAAAEPHGRIDVVYNNAGAARFAPIGEMTDADWHFTTRNELDSVFFVTRAAWPLLTRPGAVIINIASTSGHRGSTTVGGCAHSATKGAVLAFTRQVAVEGAPHGIRAVSISPGAISTPGTAFLFDNPETRDRLLEGNLIKRPGQPADVVDLALFLASDEASFITGTDYVVDGGKIAK
ncbi:MAG: dehydrogenase [Pseudonocardiales bacterium]|nr:dehydrogenase [Pseudonocardiales bacterium]